VSGWEEQGAVVLEVVRENSASLNELRARAVCQARDHFGGHLKREDLEALLSAAPQLRLLECDLWGSPTDLSPTCFSAPPSFHYGSSACP